MTNKKTRELWSIRLSEKNHKHESALSSYLNQKSKYTGMILGIDPSLRGTGLALIDFNKGIPTFIESKKLNLNKQFNFFDCLSIIFQNITIFLEKWKIRHVAIEDTIYVKNIKTIQILSATKGAIIAAVAIKNINIFEYLPLKIKKIVTGYGMSTKEEVARIVYKHLNIKELLSLDESDAASVAICHALTFLE